MKNNGCHALYVIHAKLKAAYISGFYVCKIGHRKESIRCDWADVFLVLCNIKNTGCTPCTETFWQTKNKLICECHNIVWCATNKFTKFLDSRCWNMTIPFHIVYRLSSNSMLNQIILWYSFFFHFPPKWRIIYHFYHLPLLTLSPNGTKNYRTYNYVAINYIA